MIAVDTNILIYAHREESQKHSAAKQRLTELAEGLDRWALPVFCIGEFLRILTHPRLFDPAYTCLEASEALDRLLLSPSLTVLCPGSDYSKLLCQSMIEADARGNLIFDAQIVALCREWGIRTILTEDRDFERFKGFKLERL